MSTNYYFENKSSIKRWELQNQRVDSYFDELRLNLIKMGFDEDKVNDKLEDIKWEFNTPIERLHIGKRSAGWKPLFEIQEQYSSVNEMKEWYFNNKEDWLIVDEYDRELTWDELEEKLINWNGTKSHIQFMKENYPSSYLNDYKEIDGYEWCRGEFS